MLKNRIKEIMKEKNVNAHQLSIGIGVAYTTIFDLTNRKDLGSTKLGTVQAVADFLDVDVTDLYIKE